MSAAALTIRHVEAAALGPYVDGLRALEHAIRYPLDDGRDHFRIDHGPRYTPFFTRLGEAHFLVALDGDRVVGALAGALRQALPPRGAPVASVYLCDLKVAASHRGQGVAAAMMRFALGMTRQARFRRWRLAYGAGMRGERGDVMRSARGMNPLLLGAALARLHVYFAPPQLLAKLRLAEAPPAPGPGLDLSPQPADAPELLSLAGMKDLRRDSSGTPLPLVHLPHGPGRPDFFAYLRRCGEAIGDDPAHQGAAACFALDERLPAQRAFLDAHGVRPAATCTAYGLALLPRLWRAPWVHLATSDI